MRHAGKGLVIIEIQRGTAETLDVVKKSVKDAGVKHLILWDEDNKNHRNYEIKGWPSSYLIGADGSVIWEDSLDRWLSRPERSTQFYHMLERALNSVKTDDS